MIEPDLPHPDRPEGGEDPTHTSDGSGAGSPPAAGARTWGGFQLIESLGHGGFGRVYRAWESSLAREVALKIIRVPDAALATTVLHEGRLLARVRHPNIVTVHGAQQVGDEIGIWMELIRGRSLAELVRQQGPMSADEAAVVGVHLCQAVAAVHGAGLLHRDIKAQNVMRESGGRIVLMDFGAGRETDDAEHSGRSDLPGTPRYMAPELFTGASASHASDIYSLGVLLFYLVSREFPVDGGTVMDFALAHNDRRRRSLADVRPDLPAAFVRTVERAIAPSPRERYRSAGAMLHALADAMPGSTTVRIDPTLPLDPSSTPKPIEPVDQIRDAARLPVWLRWTLALAAAIVAIGLFGFIASASFNLWLGITSEYATETPWDWWLTGLRSLIPMAVYAAFFMIVLRVGAAFWHILERLLPPALRLKSRSRMTITSVLERLGGPDARSAGHELLLAQTIAVGIVAWVFTDFLDVLMSDLNTVSAQSLEPLRDGHPKRVGYRFTLLALLLAMTAGWITLWRRQRARGRTLDRTTVAAGLAVIGLVLVMLEAPYALLFREVPRVNFDGQRCYQVGANATTLLLYCPDAPPPRSRLVPAGDARIERVAKPVPLFSPDPAP